MKIINRLFLLVLCVMPFVAGAQVATTAGNNLTAWNGGNASASNNNWNSMTNSRTLTAGANAPTADFGNCNSVILRCAQPKCGGCTTLDLARPIVAGCVNSNATCKQYGNDLVEYISAQLVATANTKSQQQQLAAQQAAAAAAAASNSQQMQQMQMQMQQMQQQMQQQNAQQMQQMQAALNEQKQMVANAQAEAAAAQQRMNESASTGLTMAQQAAVESGVSADVLLREQVGGEILSKIENAEAALKNLKESMDTTFRYAGCDTRGNNCSGPKRVKVFKDKALGFIDPYENIVDEMYEALETALAVGVDVSDVIMMLSGSCNKWGKYLCSYGYKTGKVRDSDGKLVDGTVLDNGFYTYRDNDNCVNGKSKKSNETRGIGECTPGMTVPPQDDPRCTLTSLIEEDSDELQREWFSGNDVDSDKMVRVGCATSSLDSISIFGRRSSRSGSALDLDTLERILNQDAPEYATKNRYNRNSDGIYEKVKYCGVTEKGYRNLKNAIDRKSLPKDKVCMPYNKLINEARLGFIAVSAGESTNSTVISEVNDATTCDEYGKILVQDNCETDTETDDKGKFVACNVSGQGCFWDGEVIRKKTPQENCVSSGGIYKENTCQCDADKDLQLQEGKCVLSTQAKASKKNNINQAAAGLCITKCADTGGEPDFMETSGACCKCGVTGGNYNPNTHKCNGAKVVMKGFFD
ncbi:MAG: hypothetical protein IKB59_03765 [Alphaproteobacteria bacterium]|nr:hypothetical protein [Alphaproteobacteria bacterium]